MSTDFKENIRRTGFSQRDLARAFRVHPTSVNDWAAGRREPPYAVQILVDLIGNNASLRGYFRQIIAAAPPLKTPPYEERRKQERLERWIDRELGV